MQPITDAPERGAAVGELQGASTRALIALRDTGAEVEARTTPTPLGHRL